MMLMGVSPVVAALVVGLFVRTSAYDTMRMAMDGTMEGRMGRMRMMMGGRGMMMRMDDGDIRQRPMRMRRREFAQIVPTLCKPLPQFDRQSFIFADSSRPLLTSGDRAVESGLVYYYNETTDECSDDYFGTDNADFTTTYVNDEGLPVLYGHGIYDFPEGHISYSSVSVLGIPLPDDFEYVVTGGTGMYRGISGYGTLEEIITNPEGNPRGPRFYIIRIYAPQRGGGVDDDDGGRTP